MAEHEAIGHVLGTNPLEGVDLNSILPCGRGFGDGGPNWT